MAVTVQGMIGRALMANTPEERQNAEDVATLLMMGAKNLRDWRSILVIDGGADGMMFLPADKFYAKSTEDQQSIRDTISDNGYRLIDGRTFTANGHPRKIRVSA